MQKINIRCATKDDLPAIHNLVRQLAIFENAEEEFTATLEEYHLNFGEGRFEASVAEVDGKICGMALYYLTYSTWKGSMMHLEDFIVEEGYRSLGIGQLLFDETLLQAKAKGCKLLKWEVLDWNEGALRFYIKNKAIIEKEWWNGKIFL